MVICQVIEHKLKQDKVKVLQRFNAKLQTIVHVYEQLE